MSEDFQTIGGVREQLPNKIQDSSALDYSAPAELFSCRGKDRRGQFIYRRFDTAAEAIRFAVEDLPAPALFGACLEVNEARFGRDEIHCLYEDADYPLKPRKAPSLLKGQLIPADASLSAGKKFAVQVQSSSTVSK